MTVWGRILAAGAGSAALLAGALAFQFIGGLAPCPLCIWQRCPHVAAVVIAVLGVTVLARHYRPLAVLGALAMLIDAGLGLYHTGIERGWWQGPDTCTSSSITDLSTDQLMAQILGAPLVRCDEVAWEFLSLSMASWNAVISLCLAGLWLALAVRAPNPYDSSSASQ
ncbi:MAG TPA: disulfide bond formation protein B [Thermohalobaculum sp.]|nr:disulfide bond formation protein B [Thermohalobaculum sp.]